MARALSRGIRRDCARQIWLQIAATFNWLIGKAFWEAEVTKMIKAYHAPISEADAKAIADYLAKTY
jgi:hypothetical protein